MGLDHRAASELLADPETSATVLHAIMLAEYGDELYGDEDTDPMDPVELWMRTEETFRVSIPEEVENKVNALMLALSTDAFFQDPLAFQSICTSLFTGDLGDLVNGYMEDLTIPEMMWGMFEVSLNREDDPEFARHVERVVDKNIAEEAEDRSGLDVHEVLPYFDDAVEREKAQMLRDLRKLGAPADVLREARLQPIIPEELEDGMMAEA